MLPIKFRYSGGVTNQSPDYSIGGDISVYEIFSSVDNLFTTFGQSAVQKAITDYRCFYVSNTSSASLSNLKIWLGQQKDTPNQLYLGVTVQNAVQTIKINGLIGSGSLTISLDDQSVPPIPFNTTVEDFANQIKNSLDSKLGGDNTKVLLTKISNTLYYEITFLNSYEKITHNCSALFQV
jgi:hypothetical protein